MKSIDTFKSSDWVVICHLSGLIGIFFPLGNVILPIIVWLIKGEEYPEVRKHGVHVINFHISWTIYMIFSGILVFIVIGLPLLIGLVIFGIVVSIKGVLSSHDGICYKYPLAIEFLKEKPVI